MRRTQRPEHPVLAGVATFVLAKVVARFNVVEDTVAEGKGGNPDSVTAVAHWPVSKQYFERALVHLPLVSSKHAENYAEKCIR